MENKKAIIAHAKELVQKWDHLLADATNSHKNPKAVLAEARNMEKQWNQMMRDSVDAGILTQAENSIFKGMMNTVNNVITSKEAKVYVEGDTVLNGVEGVVFHGFLALANTALELKDKLTTI